MLAFKWLLQWEKNRLSLYSTDNLDDYFTKEKINWQELEIVNAGYLQLPSGFISVDDIFSHFPEPFFHTFAKSVYPVVICRIKNTDKLFSALKITFNDNLPVRYETAMRGNEDLDNIKNTDYYGTDIKSGFCIFGDLRSLRFFSEIKNKIKILREARKKGWLNFRFFSDDNQDLNVIVCKTGFGEGSFPTWFGYDKDGVICCAIVQFIDINKAFE